MSKLQVETRKRNHNVMRLRGIYASISTIRPYGKYNAERFAGAVDVVKQSVDVMLDELGAEEETKRRQRHIRELLEELDRAGIQ